MLTINNTQELTSNINELIKQAYLDGLKSGIEAEREACARFVKDYYDAMGLREDPDFVLHSLRHTTATRLLKKTKDITKVQKLLGHKKLQTTMRYAHISDEDLYQAVCG